MKKLIVIVAVTLSACGHTSSTKPYMNGIDSVYYYEVKEADKRQQEIIMRIEKLRAKAKK